MADQGLVNFIQQSLGKGYSRSDLEQILIKKGWKPEQIQDAFTQIQTGVPAETSIETQAADYVKKYRALGYTDTQIEKALTDQKVDPVTIRKLLATGGKKPGANKKLVIGIGVVLILLIIAITAWTIFPSAECESDTNCEGGFACSDEGDCYDTCRSDSECTSGYSCVDSTCAEVECTRDADCGSGEECADNECVEIVIEVEEPEAECETDADCPELSICEENSCVEVECILDEDCGEGFACESNTCVESISEAELEAAEEEEETENYGVSNVTVTSLSTSSVLVTATLFNNGSVNGTNITYACVLYNYTSATVDSDTGTVNITINETGTVNCTLSVSEIYSYLSTANETNVTIAAALDYDDEINETDEEDNLYVVNDTWTITDFGIECISDSDCSGNETCSSNTCVECTSHSDCISGYGCVSGTCTAAASITCTDGDDCPTYYACAESGSCSADTTGVSGVADIDEIADSEAAGCDDFADNDGDNEIDLTGGCDTDADGIIDQVCGCLLFGTMVTNFTAETECDPIWFFVYINTTYGCIDVTTRQNQSVSCDELGGDYYSPDTDDCDRLETDCFDGLNNDFDSYLDYSGGCDYPESDGTRDGRIDYQCGCYNDELDVFSTYESSNVLGCDPVGSYEFTYGCYDVDDRTAMADVTTSGISTCIDAGGYYYFEEDECLSLGTYIIPDGAECTEDDGGLDEDNVGITEGISYYDGTYVNKSDACEDNLFLTEYHCPGSGEEYEGYVFNTTVTCYVGCVDGRCVDCLDDDDCEGTAVCSDYECTEVECETDEDCTSSADFGEGYKCDTSTYTCEPTECNDGLNNDGDSTYYDFLGACVKSSSAYYTCETLAEALSEAMPSTDEECEIMCEQLVGYTYEPADRVAVQQINDITTEIDNEEYTTRFYGTDCTSISDDNEGSEECSDGLDNDDDGFIDTGACLQIYDAVSWAYYFTCSLYDDCDADACVTTNEDILTQYIAADSDCSSPTDDSEATEISAADVAARHTEQVQARTQLISPAPEAEKGFFVRLLEFFIRVDVSRILRYFE